MAPSADRLRPGSLSISENACLFPYEDEDEEPSSLAALGLRCRRVFVGEHQISLHVADSRELEEEGAHSLGLHMWPGTHAMAHLLLRLEEQGELEGKSVLDVGCGTGFIGILARLAGAGRVVLSDGEAKALCAAEVNVAANSLGGLVEVQEQAWEDTSAPSGSDEVFDFVLLCEVFYVAQPRTVPWSLVDAEVASVVALAKAKLHADGTALVSYGNREEGGCEQIRAAAEAIGLTCEEVPLTEVVPAEDLALEGAISLQRVRVLRLRHAPGPAAC